MRFRHATMAATILAIVPFAAIPTSRATAPVAPVNHYQRQVTNL